MDYNNDTSSIYRRNRNNKKKRYDFTLFYIAGAAILAVVLIGALIFSLLKKNPSDENSADGSAAVVNEVNQGAGETEPEIDEREAAIERVIASYNNLGLVSVEGYLNVREQPDSNADIIGKLYNDSAFEVIDDSLDDWVQITSGGIDGYISSNFVVLGDEAKEKAKSLIEKRAIIIAESLNIRQEPNTDSEILGQALKNERYLIADDSEEGWIKINEGYISADFCTVDYALNEARKLDLKAMVLNLYDNLGISKVDNYLNIRQEPSEDGKIIGKMTSKSAGEILETSEDGKWYKIKSGPVTGYVSAEYIMTGQAAKDAALEVAELMAIVSTDRLNVRTEPNQDASIWTQISNNERYNVVSQQDGWVEIEFDSNTAFVATEFVDVRYALPEAIKFSPIDEKSARRSQLVNYALQFVGNRYVWGGNDPHTGADCSGFVRYCYSHVLGIGLERVSRDQARQGTKIDSSKMRPGDLIFYTNSGGTVNHVAMYIGNGQIVHAANRRSGIKISNWNYRNPYRIVNMIGD